MRASEEDEDNEGPMAHQDHPETEVTLGIKGTTDPEAHEGRKDQKGH